ncbi:serine hydrolase [Actinorhabdospora filicis]|uniref:Serine hydrolase n=1 Tax=Actinorhabdospora filicis TaxID=1785913 RepID=A0A9W6ST21_9ACTN|nr:serine hydrolase domain-containing protein [Actinorhabdospora filicis]GLZ81444.1 serine hydrolase [Actinorhabdospora filicis]
MTAVHGTVATGYEEVREAFAEAAARPGQDAVQLAAFVHGRPVADLWAGDGVTGETLTGVFSSGKAVPVLLAALLAADGLLDLDATVASYWPAFAAEGKDRLTVRRLLQHRAGLIGADGGIDAVTFIDDALIASRLAAHRPYWEPGEHIGYHAYTFGALVDGLVRHATGRSVADWYEERVAVPHGLDLYAGLPERLEHRYHPMRHWLATPEQLELIAGAWPSADSVAGVAYNLNATPPFDQVAFINDRAARAKGQLSAGVTGNARGLAGLYRAILGDGDRPPLLDAATLGEFTTVSPGLDVVSLDTDRRMLGFEAKRAWYPFLGEDAFGHSGAAGSDGFADPASGLAYGYVRSRFTLFYDAPENASIAEALHRAATR